MSLNVATFVLNCLRYSMVSSLLMNASGDNLLNIFRNYSSSVECRLLTTFQSLLALQKSQGQLSGTLTPKNHLIPKNQLIVIIQGERTQLLVATFHNSMSQVFTRSLFLNILIDTKHEEGGMNEALQTLDNHQNEIYAVVVVAENMTFVAALMSAVCGHAEFKWTHLLHVAEWIIALAKTESIDNFKGFDNCTDYMTFIVSTPDGIAVARKSRGQELLLGRHVRNSWSEEDLLSAFTDFRLAKKSGLEGMHLPVAVLDISKKNTGNVSNSYSTRYERFAVALAKILATTLNFTFSLVVPAEGLYGYVNEDKSATGLTGLLVRREAAFCSMGMSKTENRIQAIEFTDTQILYEPLYATYRLPGNINSIDTSLLDIVHPSFYLLLLGPILILVAIGLATHVLTNACTQATPVFSEQRMKTLRSFPDHMCFHTNTSYAGQTGRVLKGSWSVSWLIFSAAIGAFFVTSFTVKSEELKIDTLEKLLHARRYSLGLLGSNSALQDTLKTSDDFIQAALWERVSTANGTDSSILSPDYAVHISRLLSTDHVFLHHFGVMDMPLFVEADYSNVRSHLIHSLDGLAGEFLAIPKNVFFKDHFNNLVTIFDESGILKYLGLKYRIYQKEVKNRSPLECHCPVAISRIQILVYITLCIAGVCWLCLVVEIVYDKLSVSVARGRGRQL